MIEIINGNILDSTAKYIAHATNCISQKSAGLAKLIFETFPHANTYINRINPNKPGSIDILGNGINKKYIINMYSMYYPGNSKYPDSSLDGLNAREKYFSMCLNSISQIQNLESIAFPFQIMCGLGGGNWDKYLELLENFNQNVEKQNIKVYIYKLKE